MTTKIYKDESADGYAQRQDMTPEDKVIKRRDSYHPSSDRRLSSSNEKRMQSRDIN